MEVSALRKREIIRLLAYCLYGFAEVAALVFFCVAVYFVLCLLA